MKQNSTKNWIPDNTQKQIVETNGGCHLVLAPPGCGKTQILAERIRQAHMLGVAYEDMLCLTFTNRAARGMRERISENINDPATTDVFVGNVHRFCSRFLFGNSIVPAESAVIDDDTTISILAMYLQEDEQQVLGNYQRRKIYSQIMFFSHLMYELRHGIPKHLRLHPECATKKDITVLEAICRIQQRPFSAIAMLDIYDHNDFYQDLVGQDDLDFAMQQQALQTLTKMKYAHAYDAYRQQNNLLDFEDLLQLTFIALREDNSYKRYPWIQVDEVQDLNLMQLTIIDLLSTCEFGEHGELENSRKGTIIYLGDEQQAIFSFMGAKLMTLEMLKKRCFGHVHHLGVNHRSPKYLVDMLNSYATNELGSDPELLPQPLKDMESKGDELLITSSETIEIEYEDVAKLSIHLAIKYPEETTAIIVSSNYDADRVSEILTNMEQAHFKVSGQDIFATPEVKLVMSHLCVLENERNFLAWSRLMEGMKVCQTSSSARKFVHQLEERAIIPTDFFNYSDSTYLEDFLTTYEKEEIVVYDTETTGLNVFEDDIIQIAAEKIIGGKSIGKFSVHILTDREIPAMLGDLVNPIIEERKHQQLFTHKEALQQFIDFVGSGVLLAHNAEFDNHILSYNLQQNLPENKWKHQHTRCFDSLKLIRLLRPDLKAFKLKTLLKELRLEGENSHLADDDVHATASLVNYCYHYGQKFRDSQREYLGRKSVQEHIRLLRKNYGPINDSGRKTLYERLGKTEEPAIVQEMKRFNTSLQVNGWITAIPKLNYIYRFLTADVIDIIKAPSLKEQLDRYIMEITTFKEADLCGASTIDDRIFVTTIHKAKGLEFDNVIVFDVIDGRIPNYYNIGKPKAIAEDARKLYVAMSRAKHRLIISISEYKKVRGIAQNQTLSRFLTSVRQFFKFRQPAL